MNVIRIDNTTTNIGDTMKVGDVVRHNRNNHRYLVVGDSPLNWTLVPLGTKVASKGRLAKTTKGFEVISESR